MRNLLSFVFLSICLGVLAAPERTPLLSSPALHEARSSIPTGWSLHARASPNTHLPLRFALTQRNMHDLEKFLMEVSHPTSANYAKHWSADRVLETFAPSDETVSAVTSWLEGEGFAGRVKVGASKGWVEVHATAEEAERLLGAEYSVYEHESGARHVGCTSYHLPAHIKSHVDFVTPTVHFDAKVNKRQNPTSKANSIGQPGASGSSPKTRGALAQGTEVSPTSLTECDTYITPECLRALYSFNYTPVATAINSYGIVEYTPEAYLQTDINMFAMNFSEGLYGKAPYMVSIDGGYDQTEYTGFNYNGEADLDLQYGMALVTPAQEVTLYQVGDMVEGASFNNFLDALDGSYCTFEGGDDYTQDSKYPDTQPGGYNGPEACGTATPTYVISTSYGYNEADLTPFYSERQCAEYAKLGLMGITILYSSGDYGVAGNGGLCLNPNGTQTLDGTMFNPSFPGTCPYVTSVGATQVNPGSTVYEPESACEQVIYSGGGWSNYFAMPSYQKEAVDYYLANYYPDYPATMWNSTGLSRAYPDISANGANYVVAVAGQFELVYGTSCSSPVSGAIFTMINDARLAAGKAPIGFINPTIYSPSFSGLFNDITTGTNPGCNTPGFNTSAGWDPVTGLGTPNFEKLLAMWMTLP